MNKQFAATMMMIAVVMVATTTVVMTIVLQNVEAHTCVDNSASGKSHCSNSKNDNHKDLDVPGNPRN